MRYRTGPSRNPYERWRRSQARPSGQARAVVSDGDVSGAQRQFRRAGRAASLTVFDARDRRVAARHCAGPARSPSSPLSRGGGAAARSLADRLPLASASPAGGGEPSRTDAATRATPTGLADDGRAVITGRHGVAPATARGGRMGQRLCRRLVTADARPRVAHRVDLCESLDEEVFLFDRRTGPLRSRGLARIWQGLVEGRSPTMPRSLGGGSTVRQTCAGSAPNCAEAPWTPMAGGNRVSTDVASVRPHPPSEPDRPPPISRSGAPSTRTVSPSRRWCRCCGTAGRRRGAGATRGVANAVDFATLDLAWRCCAAAPPFGARITRRRPRRTPGRRATAASVPGMPTRRRRGSLRAPAWHQI